MPGIPVPYLSTVERDLLYYLEFDTSVLSYRSRPFTIRATDLEGESWLYTPDYVVERTAGPAIVHCCLADALASAATQARTVFGQGWARQNGHDFVVVTDRDLRDGHQLANVILLWRYARLAVPFAAIDASRQHLLAHPGGVRFWGLAEHLAGPAGAAAHQAPFIYSLLFHHYLVTPLDLPLGRASIVQLTAAAAQGKVTAHGS